MKEHFWSRIIVFVSLAVVILVGLLMILNPIQIETDFNWLLLPKLNACLNGTVFFLLLASWYFIKNGKPRAHKTCNVLALVCSALFLISYVTYHAMTTHTSFGGEGAIRQVYFFILITHIVLATISLPFILFTFLRAFTSNFEKHKRLARWVMPVWLYVSATGVIVYLMISPYY